MATGNNWDIDEEDGTEPNEQQGKQPKAGGLRAHAEQVKRENDELRERVEKFEAAERQRNLETAIMAKGFDSAVAGLVPKEISSDEDVTKWLETNAKLFKNAKQDEQETQQESEKDELGEDAQAWGRVSRVSSSALPPTKQADTMAAIRNAGSREDLNKVLQGFGNTNF